MKRKLLTLSLISTLSLSTVAFAQEYNYAPTNDYNLDYSLDYPQDTNHIAISDVVPTQEQRTTFTPQGTVLIQESLAPARPILSDEILSLSREELISAIVEFNRPIFSVTPEDMTHEELMELFHYLELEESNLNSPYFGAAAFADKENIIYVINNSIEAAFIEVLEKSTDQQLRDILHDLKTFGDYVEDNSVLAPQVQNENRVTFTPQGNIPLGNYAPNNYYMPSYNNDDYTTSYNDGVVEEA
jgi:hypothetical protein